MAAREYIQTTGYRRLVLTRLEDGMLDILVRWKRKKVIAHMQFPPDEAEMMRDRLIELYPLETADAG